MYLSEQIAKEIREHGARDYPHETCGAMLGLDSDDGREVVALYPLTNRRDDSTRNRFSKLPPTTCARAERAAKDGNIRTAGVVSFASRPSGTAQRV